MGTNYYFRTGKICSECGHSSGEELHIGKSSGGWCFALRVYPERNINNLSDWINYIDSNLSSDDPGTIVDEYGHKYNLSDLLLKIMNRRNSVPFDEKITVWVHAGYTDEEDFHRINCSERGPNNLLRHKVKWGNCIGHGEGTWDLLDGDFS